MKNRMHIKGQGGFTIIELLIATVIFSVIVLVATAGIIRIGQMYYKGVTVSQAQERARQLSEEMSRAVQFSKISVIDESTPPVNVFCIADSRYFYIIDTPHMPTDPPSTTNPKGLVAQRFNDGFDCGTCPKSGGSCVRETIQLLGNNMRLLDFGVAQIPGSSAWSIKVSLAYGDGDLLTEHDENTGDPLPAGNPANSQCRTNISGSSFCATAHLDTIVKRRLQ